MTETSKTGNTELALKRAQAFNESITRYIFGLIETTKHKGAPNAATLIRACEEMLRISWKAGEGVATEPGPPHNPKHIS